MSTTVIVTRIENATRFTKEEAQAEAENERKVFAEWKAQHPGEWCDDRIAAVEWQGNWYVSIGWDYIKKTP